MNHLTVEPTKRRLLYLDGWRGVSIILVLIGHFFPVPGINLGLFGVELFFVLSGRLMGEILFVERFPLKQFFRRRFFRIYPALVVFIVSCMVVLNDTYMSVRWTTALSTLTFTYNYLSLIIKKIQTVDHIWSLCIEEHTYLVLGIVAYFSAKGKVRTVPALYAITILSLVNGVTSYFVTGNYELSYWRTDSHIASISVSALICILKSQARLPVFMSSSLTPIIAVPLALIFTMQFVPLPLHYLISTPLLALAVNSLDGSPSAVKKFMSNKLLVQLGLWSYSIYLYQQPFFKVVNDGRAHAVSLIGPVIVCGIASYYFVENPARLSLNKRFARFVPRKATGHGLLENGPPLQRT